MPYLENIETLYESWKGNNSTVRERVLVRFIEYPDTSPQYIDS
jgi:hypothetical protein